GRMLAVLEPRSNTMKRGVMKDELPASLAAADRVFVYTAGLGWDAEQVFAALGQRANTCSASNAIATIEKLMQERQGQPFCFVGSSLGGFYATYLAEKHGARAV